ncbi:MAG: orotidine-5'-phosphate decarboxylase [Lachnospiraceae bacterium]|nr:orotidine-5'-phosphate decarboxylase [Lachnospiraceae bacterium]
MINKLVTRIKDLNAPVVVGLDPKLSFIPDHIKADAFAKHGENLKGASEAVFEFNRQIIDKIYDIVPAVKPQIAMYEQFGVEGMIAFKKTVDYAKDMGLIVIGDIKRGDIGSTSEAYADGHIGSVLVGKSVCHGFDEDFVTVNPYLGSDGIEPFIQVAKVEKKGLFILVKTSNPSSGELQDKVSDGFPIYEHVAMMVDAWASEHMGKEYSNIGAVCGATYPEIGMRLRMLMPKSYILVPGYGAQGASARDLLGFFNDDGYGAIVNSSRGIIAAYQQENYETFGEADFANASRQAAIDMIQDINWALGH